MPVLQKNDLLITLSRWLMPVMILLASFSPSLSQTIHLSKRPESAMKGSELAVELAKLSIHDRESRICKEVLSGNVPMFYRNLVEIVDSLKIDGNTLEIKYFVTSDYLAIGSDYDYFLCPMTPLLAQRIADSLNCTMPTRRMVDRIWAESRTKMQPQPIPPSDTMTTVPVFILHNEMVIKQQKAIDHVPGILVSGHKKDIVISNAIYSSESGNVVIYGWHDPDGSPIQPLYSGHSNTYADYSHGVRLISMDVLVNGQKMNIKDVLGSPILHGLLSDEGMIQKTYYPDTVHIK